MIGSPTNFRHTAHVGSGPDAMSPHVSEFSFEEKFEHTSP